MDGTHDVCELIVLEAGCSRDSKVCDFYFSICGNDDILRLHIPVNDAVPVGRLEPHADLDGDAGGLAGLSSRPFLSMYVLQGDALHQLHDNVADAVILPDIVHIDDVGMGRVLPPTWASTWNLRDKGLILHGTPAFSTFTATKRFSLWSFAL